MQAYDQNAENPMPKINPCNISLNKKDNCDVKF